MPLTPGARLGPYEVLSALGAGGMGEVYRGRDTRLGRDVALKVLPAAFTADPERLARFQREAQVLAALNHPHIAQIYGVEDGALVMELVDGGTLADRIAAGPIPVIDALAIARQLADAFEAAHEKSIIHRDLKPSNIAFTTDGQVKVLDFGLAKLATSDANGSIGSSALSLSPTITSPAVMTGAGVLLGTAAYMAPEQVKGREADKRSDVWAFGCVLYEMLTGVRPFEAEDVADTLAYTLTKEPDWSKLPADLPVAVAVVLRRCLVKDRRRRTGDIAAVQFVLDEAPGLAPPAAASAPALPAPSSRRRRAAAIVALLVAAIVLTAVGTREWQRRTAQPPAPVRFAVTPAIPMMIESPGGGGNLIDRPIAITADGAHVFYRGGTALSSDLMVRALDQLEAHPLGVGGMRNPTPSPDGRWIAFMKAGELRKISITGGPSILVTPFMGNPRGMSWGDDNTLVFAVFDGTVSKVYSVAAGGGEAKVLLAPDPSSRQTGFWFPSMLPGSQAVLYTAFAATEASSSQAPRYPSDNGEIGVLDRRTKQTKIVLRGGTDARYVDSGHLIYTAGGALRAVPFDLARLEVIGDPVPIVDGVAVATSGEALFAVSRTGTLIYVPARGAGAGVELSLVWVDRHGREEPIAAPPRYYTYPRISPDGTRLLLDIRDQENDLWIWEFARQTLTRLTFDPGTDRAPLWTADGKRVIYASQRTGVTGGGNIFMQAADGTGAIERLTTSPQANYPTSVAPDGKHVVFRLDTAATKMDLMLLTLDGTPRITPLIQTMFNEQNGAVSPDGRWLVYESDESGQSQIYVRPFPQVDSGRWQVSPAGGTRPLWARNGRELFYLNAMSQLMAVPVQTTPTFSAGNPAKLFDTVYLTPNNGVTYDVSPDGQKFVMVKGKPETGQASAPPASLVVVLNWFQELQQRVTGK